MTVATAFPIPPLTRFRRHNHDSGHICAVLAGGFIERDKSSWRDVGPGTVRVSGGAHHDIDFSDNGALCLVMEVTSDEIGALGAPRFFENDLRLSALAYEMKTASDKGDAANSLKSESLTTEFLAQLSRRLNGKPELVPPWLERVRSMIHDTAGRITVSGLAIEAEVHRVHLARTFRDHYGIPVTRYARQVKVQTALGLLRRKDISLAHVAFETGFADQSHLTRAVRAESGRTPGAIRSMLQSFKT
ncbi:MAG: helix-turn-helix transcriptional regulator [Gemmatimonadales bacterium]